ncbi:hypothetical protein HYU18_01120 [Candidatus Woesearchaeota archaeon]|nr:hypothetical protein [Candidatus Woesearchaeota archaeon]
MLPILFQTFTGVRNVPDFLVQLEQFGLLDAVIPFILIFAIVFTVSKTAKVLGENKSVHMVVALSLALLVVIPHITGTYPPGRDVVNIINNALPNVSLVIVIIIAALIMTGLFTKPGETSFLQGGFFGFVAVGAIIYIFGLSAGWWQSVTWLSFLSNPDIQAVLVIVLVFALVIFLITSEKPMDTARNFRNLLTGK